MDRPLTSFADAKPCPFCGSRNIVKGCRYFAMCVDCGATGPERVGDKGGIKIGLKDWNSRVLDSSSQPDKKTVT